MKKLLLGLSAVAALFLLSACGSTDETVCTMSMFGEEMIFIVESEDGVISSLTTEIRMDMGGLGLDSDELAEFAEAEGGVINGDEIIITETDSDLDENLEDFIASMELIGASCN